jgi:hypothetical protein
MRSLRHFGVCCGPSPKPAGGAAISPLKQCDMNRKRARWG